MDRQIHQQIIAKKEFSQLPKKDVELAFSHFENKVCSDAEKIRLTRRLLFDVFGAFTSYKLFNSKNKTVEWILKKHISTRERFPYYKKIYLKILKNLPKKISVIDLGCGVNGFSYDFFNKIGKSVNYIGVESIGQLVDLSNYYFKKNKLKGMCYHLSLFELEKIKKLIKKQLGQKIVFLFKTLDSLEMLQRNYSKKLLKEIVGLVDKIVVSFATKSLFSKKQFFAKRKWLVNFIKDNFEMLDDFELGGERYIIFSK